jgi:hypothetical protein
MVDCDEGDGEVKETDKCNVTTTSYSHEVGYNLKNCGLSRVAMSVGGLHTWEETIQIEVSNQLMTDQSLHDFKHVGQVQDWSVVLQVCRIGA